MFPLVCTQSFFLFFSKTEYENKHSPFSSLAQSNNHHTHLFPLGSKPNLTYPRVSRRKVESSFKRLTYVIMLHPVIKIQEKPRPQTNFLIGNWNFHNSRIRAVFILQLPIKKNDLTLKLKSRITFLSEIVSLYYYISCTFRKKCVYQRTRQ